ncbi:hypothetical protein PMAYCL1PPCAC_01402, partial [Pristionchus mayeri]
TDGHTLTAVVLHINCLDYVQFPSSGNMAFLRCILASSLLFAVVYGQCGTTDTGARCAQWKEGGFCTNEKYKLEYRQATCGNLCGLCGAAPEADPCAGTTENANCAAWEAKPEGFCKNPKIADTMKKQYCCKTCFPPTPKAPTTTCGVIYEGTETEAVNSAPTKAMEPVPKQPISKAYVKNGCTLTLYEDPFTTAAGSPLVPNRDSIQFNYLFCSWRAFEILLGNGVHK